MLGRGFVQGRIRNHCHPLDFNPYIFVRAIQDRADNTCRTTGDAPCNTGDFILKWINEGSWGDLTALATSNAPAFRRTGVDEYAGYDGIDDRHSITSAAAVTNGTLIVATRSGIAVTSNTLAASTLYQITAKGFTTTYTRAPDNYVTGIWFGEALTPTQIKCVIDYFVKYGALESYGTVSNFTHGWSGSPTIKEFPLIDTSAVTNMGYTWYACTGLTSFPLIDTSAVTNMAYTWTNCSGLTSFPLIDTSAVTNMGYTWYACTGLTSFPLIDTSSVTRMEVTWLSCLGLTSFPLIDTSSVTNMSGAWYNCQNLANFPLIDTSSVTNMQDTWRECFGLTSFPLINTSSVTNFTRTWYRDRGLTSFPLINTSAGLDFTRTWYDCKALTSFPLINTSAGLNFTGTWTNCLALTSFPALDMSSGTDFTGTWENCVALTSFPLIDVSSGRRFNAAWSGCGELVDFPAGMFDTWVPGTPLADCFLNTWGGAVYKLSSASVQNILTSIDTSGVSGPAGTATQREITINYNAETGALTAPTVAAINSLKLKNWSININGTIQ